MWVEKKSSETPVSARDRVRLFWDSNSGQDEPPSALQAGPARGGPSEIPTPTEYVDTVRTNALQPS